MTVMDDKHLALRLAERPEFLLRLDGFMHSYGIGDRPTLVVQARPALGRSALNIDEPAIQQRFLAGAETQNGWWQGFRSRISAKPSFHGVASLPIEEAPAWASEMHRDGHFIAGVWKFPEISPSHGANAVPAICDFYGSMFQDFFTVVASTLEVGANTVKYEVTATLVGAPSLHFAKRSEFGNQFVIGARPLPIQNLQWIILAAEVGTPEWHEVAIEMGRALAGAFGEQPNFR